MTLALRNLTFNGVPVPVAGDQTVAGALWRAGIRSWRTTRHDAQPRGLFCSIGACHDCLVTIDGVNDQRACVTPAQPGQVVTTIPTDPAAAPTPPAALTPPAASAASAASVASSATVARHDILVVGGGPAGLAAAASAALGGGRVALLDAGPRLGGQYWRHRPGANLGRVFAGLASLVEERVDHIASAEVWLAESTSGTFVLHTSAGTFTAARVVLATGAYDRALPFPGWTLPGVVTPGAAQALLKGSGVAIGERVVVAGAGPFLLPVAVGLLEAGVGVVEVVEAGRPQRYAGSPFILAGSVAKLGEAASYGAVLARHRVPYRLGEAVVAAHAGPTGSLAAVDIAPVQRPDQRRRVECDAVAVGYGFTANLELALALGAQVRVTADGGLAVAVGGDGRTTVPGLYAAGEITGIGGASLAIVEGELAGAAAAGVTLTPRELAARHRKRDRLRSFAELMHAAHPVPANWPSWLAPDDIVCRCEEVTYGDIAEAVEELGATDARSVKLLTRPGMGWCQGRTCGFATACLTATLTGRRPQRDDLEVFARRPFAAAVTLGELAAEQ